MTPQKLTRRSCRDRLTVVRPSVRLGRAGPRWRDYFCRNPGLEVTGLLACATTVFDGSRTRSTAWTQYRSRGCYGPCEPRAEDATRVNPAACLGRVLGLAGPGGRDHPWQDHRSGSHRAGRELLAAMAAGHVPAWTTRTRTCLRCSTSTGPSVPAMVGARSSRPTSRGCGSGLHDRGDVGLGRGREPGVVVMDELGASLAMELHRPPDHRRAEGDQRRDHWSGLTAAVGPPCSGTCTPRPRVMTR